MEIWTPEKFGEKKYWNRQRFGSFPDPNQSLREAILKHLQNRNDADYPATYWIVFSPEEEAKIQKIAEAFLQKDLRLADTVLTNMLVAIAHVPGAPIPGYTSEDPENRVAPPFRLALMFRVKR